MEPEIHVLSKFFAHATVVLWLLLGVWVIPRSVWDAYQAKQNPSRMMTVHLMKDGEPLPPLPWVKAFWGPGTPVAEMLRVGVMCAAAFCVMCVLKGI